MRRRFNRRLDMTRLDAWLEAEGKDRHWLADKIFQQMSSSSRKRRGHATTAKSVEVGINRWQERALTPMYQALLLRATAGASENWYLDGWPVRTNTLATPDAARQDNEGDPLPKVLSRRRSKNAAESPKSIKREVRHPFKRIRRDQSHREGLLNRILQRNYNFRQYEIDLKNARSLSITGSNLRRIVTNRYLPAIHKVMMRAKDTDEPNVKVLMHDPLSNLCETAMIQDKGFGSNIHEYRELVATNLSAFCWLRAKSPRGDKLLIRTMEYMPTFGLDVIDGGSRESSIWIRFYPLPDPSEDDKDKPIVRLTENDGFWYEFFSKQFDQHWDCGIATDVADTYDWQSQETKFKSKLTAKLIKICSGT